MDRNNLLDEIEAEYDAYCLERTKNPKGTLNPEHLYEKLNTYLRGFITSFLSSNGFMNRDAAEEVTQDTLAEIAAGKIDDFEKKNAKFSTFCTAIAKNKAVDYMRKTDRYLLHEFNEREEKTIFVFGSKETYSDPETLFMMRERIRGQIQAVKKYLHKIVNLADKPYRTVGCCYTMILFHRHHHKTKELSSPKWAYDTIQEDTVHKSADKFMEEMNEWFPKLHLVWGDAFLEGMEQKENEIYIRDMVFGEHFTTKDFENWSLRLRKKMREELLKEVCEVL